MAARGGKRGAKRKGAQGYKLPDPIPAGEVLKDISGKRWIIGASIGVGGFGEIYSAAPYEGKTPKDYPAVVKIEPHGNGPLFVEMHFYMRNAKPADIDAWKKSHNLSALGMPRFVGSGSHECHKTKYRFVVMDRYGTDLWKLFLANGRRFPEHTVYRVALQIIDVLEYIHGKTYVHADIKGGNLLLDVKSGEQVYLVDFGLASHYNTKAEYKLDPKKAHNGTIEYTSRDAHMGVPTMRGDMEILAYNVIQWLCGSLPWENNLTDPTVVQKQKCKAFENVTKFLGECFAGSAPQPVREFTKLLAAMDFNDVPKYDKFRKILSDGLKSLGCRTSGKLEFKTSAVSKPNGTATVAATAAAAPAKTKTVKPQKPPILKAPMLSRESTIGTVISKKRGGANDIKKALEDIELDESDAEYDIHITRKRRKSKGEETGKTVRDKTSRVVEKKVELSSEHEETGSDFETETLFERKKEKEDLQTGSDSETLFQRKLRANGAGATKAARSNAPSKRVRKKVQRYGDYCDMDSDSEAELAPSTSKGTRSRPKVTRPQRRLISDDSAPELEKETYSDADIFADDDTVEATPPKLQKLSTTRGGQAASKSRRQNR